MEPIRILYVNGGPMNRGGIESYMMNYYRNFDKSKVQVDFVAIGHERAAYDDEIESLGGRMHYLPKKSKNYLGYQKGLRDILKTGKYKIVHTHMDAMGMTVLKQAKKCNIPIRIAHSHNTQHLTNNFIKFKINEYARKNINKYATHMFACSELAGRWLFGDKEFEDGKVRIVKNAIDIEKFKFNLEKRKIIRERYGILNSETLIGHIGRFDYQKNHSFIIDLFKKINEKDERMKLMLIGDGDLRGEIEKIIEKFNIKDKVILTGIVNNPQDYYNAFDVFILPSLFEGLPVVGIEAQASGIPCIFSDTISNEIMINQNAYCISIKDIDSWISKVFDITIKERIYTNDYITEKGYNIKKEAIILQQKYMSLFREIS